MPNCRRCLLESMWMEVVTQGDPHESTWPPPVVGGNWFQASCVQPKNIMQQLNKLITSVSQDSGLVYSKWVLRMNHSWLWFGVEGITWTLHALQGIWGKIPSELLYTFQIAFTQNVFLHLTALFFHCISR